MTRPGAAGQHQAVSAATFVAAVGAELRRAFSPPYEAPAVVAVNGLLMAGAWFLLPANWFFELHTARIFPITLAVWMLSDVAATNVLGSDARRMSLVLDQPRDLHRMLAAKNLVLWLLITPVCATVAVVVGLLARQTLLSALATIAALAIVPFGALGVAAWLGILYPYHALPLAVRWQHRRPYGRMVVRWLLLVLIPWSLVPLAAIVVNVAPVLLAGLYLSSGTWATGPDRAFALGVLIFAAVDAAAWFGGHAVAARLAGRRSQALREFLADPLHG